MPNSKYKYKKKELKKDEAEYEQPNRVIKCIRENTRKKNKLFLFQIIDQDLHTNDAQNFFANDNISILKMKLKTTYIKQLGPPTLSTMKPKLKLIFMKPLALLILFIIADDMNNSISEAQDDLYDNTNLNQSDNEEDNETSDDDVNKFIRIIIEATEAGTSSLYFEVDRTSLERLFKRAVYIKKNVVQENQVEIRCWFNYGKEYKNCINQIMTQNNLFSRRATMQIYSSLRSILSRIDLVTLYRRTQKAQFVYMLFKQIGEDKIE
ncbi:36285_t:CDS:2, partial [Gigaspora margarita]